MEEVERVAEKVVTEAIQVEYEDSDSGIGSGSNGSGG